VDYARRRLAREPVGRILGAREFWGLPFELSPETLEPRPDSETVVAAALGCFADRGAPLRVLDLGTGSGILLVALLHELPGAWGVGADRSHAALTTARRNAWRNGVGERAAFVAGDWSDALAGRFDLIVSNPPYIPTADIAALSPEVRDHDPRAALDGGRDGLAAYRAILADVERLMAARSVLVVETGAGQAQSVTELASAHGFRVHAIANDLSGRSRAVVAEGPPLTTR
jgi:release factor glutamine methyltransferase